MGSTGIRLQVNLQGLEAARAGRIEEGGVWFEKEMLATLGIAAMLPLATGISDADLRPQKK